MQPNQNRSHLILAALLTSLIVSASNAQERPASDFCSTIHEIMGNSYNNFRKFRGTKSVDEGDEDYNSLMTLPNASFCKINVLGFDCQWSAVAGKWAETVSEARVLAKSIAACEDFNYTEFDIESEPTPDGPRLSWRALIYESANPTQIEVNASDFFYVLRRLDGKAPRHRAYINLDFKRRR